MVYKHGFLVLWRFVCLAKRKQNQELNDNRVTYEQQPKKAPVKLRWKTHFNKKMEEIKMNNYDHLRS